jgi:hypothetical protein
MTPLEEVQRFLPDATKRRFWDNTLYSKEHRVYLVKNEGRWSCGLFSKRGVNIALGKGRTARAAYNDAKKKLAQSIADRTAALNQLP